MEINSLTALLVLFTSLVLGLWYKFAYQPQKKLQMLIAQGARRADFKMSPHDDFDGIKKAIQIDPDMKAVVKKLPGKVFINFVDAESIKEVLTNHHYYDKLNKTSELTKLLTSKSVIIAEGANWKLHRVLISEAFQYSFFNDMIPTIVKTTDEVMSISSRKEKIVPLPDTTELITADVATKTFFGMESANILTNGRRAADELSYMTMKMVSYGMSPLRFFPGMWALNFFKDYRDIKRRIKNFRKIFSELMVKRMQEIEKGTSGKETHKRETDILEIMLQYRHKFNNDPTKTLTDREILDNFFLFCVAGKDTTSSLVTMSLYCFVKNPEWAKKLKEEVENTITKPEAINLDLLNSMTFMSAYLNEVLRIYPPAPMLLARISNVDHYVGNIFVEKGTIVSASVVASNNNPKYFEDPEKFNPTRWLKSETNEKTPEGWKNNPFSYLPFSGGPRNCIGKHFALIEAKVILSLILKYYDVSLDPGFQAKMGHIGVAYLPKEPIPFKFTPK